MQGLPVENKSMSIICVIKSSTILNIKELIWTETLWI
jgi:hypothetical protein